MKLNTQLPLATIFFKHWGIDDREVGIVVAKASFARSGKRWVAEDEPMLVLEDTFAGDPSCTPLVQEQDIAPGKRGTDLIVHATARSPEAALLTDWPVSLTVPDRLHYGFHVRGPSRWTKGRRGKWKQTTPELVSEVPLTYALAYGGSATDQNDKIATFENNPSGMGYATAHHLATCSELPAPQIGLLADLLGADPLAQMGVEGFGPISKSWLPRRANAGTFDETWKATRHPRMPKDYALSFWNAAPGPLQSEPPLVGNEVVLVEGISHEGPVLIKLPAVACAVQFDGDTSNMVLDTITLDLRSADPSDYRVDLIWRTIVAATEEYQSAEIVGFALED